MQLPQQLSLNFYLSEREKKKIFEANPELAVPLFDRHGYTPKDYIKCYKWTGSVHRAGELMEVSHSVVHTALKKAGYRLKGQKFDQSEDQIIQDYYQNTDPDHFSLDELTGMIGNGRSKTNISRRARQLGLTNSCRPPSISVIKRQSKTMKEVWRNRPHPRGSLGLKHSKSTRNVLSEKSRKHWEQMGDEDLSRWRSKQIRTRIKNGTLNPMRNGVTWRGGTRKIGSVERFYRSAWEANYARYLELCRQNKLILSWEHEPEIFEFVGVEDSPFTCLPDFRVGFTDGRIEYHEVKGWEDKRSLRQISRMAEFYPHIDFVVVRSKHYLELSRQFSKKINGWEG